MAESLQHKLDRVRRPRVQITYDVETGGAMQKIELPFVVGVLADLSGQPKEAAKPLKERKAVKIDRDNFNDVLAKAAPRVAFRVQNRLNDEQTTLAEEGPSLLDQVIQATRPQDQVEANRAKNYFRQFLDHVVQPGQVVSKDVEANIKYWIGEIDKALSSQLNEIMHHQDFQKLE